MNVKRVGVLGITFWSLVVLLVARFFWIQVHQHQPPGSAVSPWRLAVLPGLQAATDRIVSRCHEAEGEAQDVLLIVGIPARAQVIAASYAADKESYTSWAVDSGPLVDLVSLAAHIDLEGLPGANGNASLGSSPAANPSESQGRGLLPGTVRVGQPVLARYLERLGVGGGDSLRFAWRARAGRFVPLAVVVRNPPVARRQATRRVSETALTPLESARIAGVFVNQGMWCSDPVFLKGTAASMEAVVRSGYGSDAAFPGYGWAVLPLPVDAQGMGEPPVAASAAVAWVWTGGECANLVVFAGVRYKAGQPDDARAASDAILRSGAREALRWLERADAARRASRQE